ncbi:hypothetical protein ACFQ73_32965, partial [Amycolatopsis japonica]
VGAVRNMTGSASPENGDFDLGLRELQAQAGVDILCGFLTDMGRELGKSVLMTSEARPIRSKTGSCCWPNRCKQATGVFP